MSDAAFSRHAASVGLTRSRKDLWVPAGTDLSHDQRIDAALETLGGDVLITGASALHFDGVLTQAPAIAELLVPAARHLRNWPGTCIHRSTTFGEVRAHHVRGRKLAAVPRSFADRAAHATVDDLCQEISTALRLRLGTLGTVALELGVRQRFPGRGRLARAIAELHKEVVHSKTERLARRHLRPSGLRPHHEPLRIDDEHGKPIAEIDIAFPGLMLGIEIDGPHHLLPHVAAADRQRDRQLASLGWRIERFYWFEVEERRAWFVAQVQRFAAEQVALTGR